MRFGPTPLADAEGGILAHTLRVEGAVLKKGRVLGRGDVDALAAAGHREVVVARLDPGDVAEDEAAAALAAALAGPGVEAARAFTGRANLYARERGLLLCPRDRVDRLNAVHEAVTFATLPPEAVVEPGHMVATVKIIPFAVPGAVLEAALAECAAGAPWVEVAPFRRLRAGLILTELPGTRPAVLERASESQRVRLARLGGEIAREIRCAHEVEALRAAVETLRREHCDPILVLGASAIVDRDDVIPAAFRAAGAHIERLGMPVDPGNLLLLARDGDAALIGVPGCARSLKPSGFDAVLAGVAAGRDVASADLAAMGSGGLLKELPSRPQPRGAQQVSGAAQERDLDAGAARIAALVLAAGESRRMPDANKLLCPIGGEPMVARVVRSLSASALDPIVVVTGHEADRVAAALGEYAVSFAHNDDYSLGMSGSLRVGLEALPDSVDAALVCLGDMPWVDASVVQALLAAFDPDDPRICVPVFDRKRGNPVLWPARYFPEMRVIEGDQGARHLLETYADEITPVAMDDDGVVRDVDTPESLAAARARPEASSR